MEGPNFKEQLSININSMDVSRDFDFDSSFFEVLKERNLVRYIEFNIEFNLDINFR